MPTPEHRRPVVAWLDRWLLTIWTPIVLIVLLAPIFWWARDGNLTAGWIVTVAIEAIGALLIVTLAAKIWRDQRRPKR